MISISLACVLLAMPLLPGGPVYLGFRPFAYVDFTIAPLVALWLGGRMASRGRPPAPWPLPLWPWHILIAVIAGSALFGLMAEHRIDSAVFVSVLREHLGDLLRPMDQAAHPLQPLRVALTFVEGWLTFLLVADLCRRAPDPAWRGRVAVAGWLAGAALVSVLALAQYATRYQLHPYWLKANPHIVRAHATLDDPNALGACLVLGIGLLSGWLYLDARRRALAWTLLLVIAAGLLTTMSRAAIGGAILGPVLVLALLPGALTRRQRTVRMGGRLVLAALLAILLVSTAFRTFTTGRTRTQPTSEAQLVLKTLDPRESSDWVLRGRVAWWKAAGGMFADHPVTGVGLGRFPRLLEEYGGGGSRENAHNLVLQLLAEAGLPGALAFIIFATALCVALFGAVRRGRDAADKALALGGGIAVTAFLLTLVTGHTLLVPSGQMLFASFVAAVGCAAGTGRATPHGGPPRARVGAIVTCAVLLVAYPAAGRARGIGPRLGAWGYASGLFPEEPAGGGLTYRWTGAGALLDLDVPRGATALELPIAAPTPVRGGAPTRVTFSAGQWIHERLISTPDVQTIRVPLDRGFEDPSGRILLRVQVTPVFTPASVDPASTDTRTLGIQLLSPAFTR